MLALAAVCLLAAAQAALADDLLVLPQPGEPLQIIPEELVPSVAPPVIGPPTVPPDHLTPQFDPYFYDQSSPWQWPEGLPIDGYGRSWSWQFLPEGLIYRSYLAGPKESRFLSNWAHEKDLGSIWDITLGGRVGVFRYGSQNSFRPEGWQIDIEGAAMPRLDWEEERDLISADFRFGVPLTYAVGMFETKLAYYHLSSHLGDEFLLKNPWIQRINYSRDVVVFGLATYWTEDVRLYAEAGYGVVTSGGAEPWEFQFGAEYSPVAPTYVRGAPFAAINGYLREEVDFGGTLTVQAGWQWRGYGSRHLFRAGVQYLSGKSPQLQFFDRNEQQLGFVLWYDY
jgi:hypothetical protein